MNDPEVEFLKKSIAVAFFGKFSSLTQIQKKAIPILSSGSNLVLSAGTGSGKTEASLSPILSRLWDSIHSFNNPLILYIAPTKALVNDLERRLSPILETLNLKVGIRHGDRDDLKNVNKPNVLITTPESLDVLLFRKDKSLDNIKSVILDEVHLLYNTQRGLQLSVLLNRLKKNTGNDIQWVALSATIEKLENVKNFLFGEEEKSEYLKLDTKRKIDSYVCLLNNDNDLAKITKKMMMRPNTKLLIFANSRKQCEYLSGILTINENSTNSIFTHYSSLSTELRLETEKEFAKRNSAICISTSTLELGIDIGDIDAIILWDMPNSVESFLQRIGRGNRRSNKSNVVCIVTPDSETKIFDVLYFLTLYNCSVNGDLAQRDPLDLFGSIPQQFLSIIGSRKGAFTKTNDLFESISFNNAKKDDLLNILSELCQKEFLTKHGFKNQFGGNENLYKLIDYKMIYGNFPLRSNTIDIKHESKLLGSIPYTNIFRIKRGCNIQFAGKRWEVKKISTEGIVVLPSSTKNKLVEISYSGKGLGKDAFLINKLWELIHNNEFCFEIIEKDYVEVIMERIKSFNYHITEFDIPCTESDKGWCHYTFGGYIINKLLSEISKFEVLSVNDIYFETDSKFEFKEISNNVNDYIHSVEGLLDLDGNRTFYQTLLPIEIQKKEFLENWLKDNSFKKILNRLSKSNSKVVSPEIMKLIL